MQRNSSASNGDAKGEQLLDEAEKALNVSWFWSWFSTDSRFGSILNILTLNKLINNKKIIEQAADLYIKGTQY